MNHIAAIIIACWLIALAISRAAIVIVNQNAILILLLMVAHVAIWNNLMHVLMLIQVIMVEMVMMMTVRSIRRICIWKVAMMMMAA